MVLDHSILARKDKYWLVQSEQQFWNFKIKQVSQKYLIKAIISLNKFRHIKRFGGVQLIQNCKDLQLEVAIKLLEFGVLSSRKLFQHPFHQTPHLLITVGMAGGLLLVIETQVLLY